MTELHCDWCKTDDAIHPVASICAHELKRKDALIEDLKEHLMSCFSQGTHIRPDYAKQPDKWVYDHMCLSAYEDAQDFLIGQGMIKKEECSRK